VRDIYIKGWSLLATAEQAQRAARLLVDFGYVSEMEERATGGRPTCRYIVNPRART
jgi:hypothetical protein